jgi:hypothetical protein
MPNRRYARYANWFHRVGAQWVVAHALFKASFAHSESDIDRYLEIAEAFLSEVVIN